jgi:hypothetical protein
MTIMVSMQGLDLSFMQDKPKKPNAKTVAAIKEARAMGKKAKKKGKKK